MANLVLILLKQRDHRSTPEGRYDELPFGAPAEIEITEQVGMGANILIGAFCSLTIFPAGPVSEQPDHLKGFTIFLARANILRPAAQAGILFNYEA
jgi:hypothetical protein